MKILLYLFLICITANVHAQKDKKYEGSFSNGMKGAKFSFVLSADGKKVKNVTFQGYWRCDGKLELTTMGPSDDKSFPVVNGKVDGIIVEPEKGGSTAFRFELHGVINGKQANGTFRMNINALACDSYKLNWTATAK